jgi:hypothetical protein
MPLFSYTATNNEGKKIVGQQEADSRDQIVQMLHDQSLVVISVEEKIEIDFKKLGSIQIGGVPLNEKSSLYKAIINYARCRPTRDPSAGYHCSADRERFSKREA